MTHSQESRVSSSQDTFRLTEESISRRVQFNRATMDEIDAFQSSLNQLSSSNYYAGISLPWKMYKQHADPAVVSSLNDVPYICKEEKSVSALVNRLNSCLAVGTEVFDDNDKLEKMAATSNQDEKKLEATFPWLAAFGDLCRAAVGSKSIKRLEHLLNVYLGNVSVNVKDCYMKPNRAAKLKKCMNETLIFFHLFYQDIREPMEHSSYLDKMTELVSMYMDMEIKASRRRKEGLKKVACRLASSLYIFLDNSEDHILDAILKAKLVNKHYRDVCIPMLGKILNNVRTYPLYEMLYVRYLLVFKMWKKVVADSEERKRINKIAVQKLTPPANFMEKSKIFNNVLPKIPKSKKNITLFFMQAKFNLKNACTAFLKGCKDSQQSGFSQNLSVNMDKPLFFSERLMQVAPTLSDKCDDMDGNGSSNLMNDIWSSISNVASGLTENSHLRDLTVSKSKMDLLPTKKKLKDKIKKKAKKREDIAKDKSKSVEKGKKKKFKKKALLVSGDTASVLSDATFSDTSLLKKPGKCEKTKKKKKKKLDCIDSEDLQLPVCDTGVVESANVLEANVVMDSASHSASEPVTALETPSATQDVSQIAVQVQPQIDYQPTSQDIVTQVATPAEEGLLEVKVDVEAVVEVEVEAEAEAQVKNTNEVDTLGQAQVMVNQVNSAGETLADSVVKENEKCEEQENNEEDRLNQVNHVNSADCVEEPLEQSRVTVIATGVQDPVVPSSSCNTFDSMATSQNSGPVTQENEAVANEVSKKSDDVSTDAVLPRTVGDPVLVPSQANSDPEALLYACDSSINNEVPISGENFMHIGSDDFNSVPMEIDSDVEILAELRPQVTVGCGVTEEIVLSDDGEIMKQESDLASIFATKNSDVVIEMFDECPGSFELDNPQGPGGGGEPESPEMENLDAYDTFSLSSVMQSLLRSKGDFSNFGGERRDCLYRDSMLHPDTHTNYEPLAHLEGSVNANRLMEDDDCEEATSDDELESCYEMSHSHGTYAHVKRPCIKGGKVGFNGAVSSNGYANIGMNDKEVSDSSPSSSIENDTTMESSIPSKNSYISSRNNVYNSGSDSIPVDSGRDTPSYSHIGLKTPALSTARSPASSTPKRISDVNTIRYYTSMLDQPVRSESVENRTESSSLEEPQTKRTSSPKKVSTSSTCTAEAQQMEDVVPSAIDSTYANRRVTVELTQLSPDSAADGFPDVLDANKLSGQQEKETMKTPSRGMLSETSNVCGKLGRTYIDGLYRGVPLSNSHIPTSVQYPAITAPIGMGKLPFTVGQYVRCTCSECYASHVMFLSNYNSSSQGGDQYAKVPVQYCDSSIEANAEKLKCAEKMKSEDEELLRKIEESLSDTKVKSEKDMLNSESESKYKPEVDSSLPLKKRLKTLAHITETTNVKAERSRFNCLTLPQSFPSYPTRPMISIAELDLSKHVQRPVKTTTGSQRYIPYSDINYYPTHLQGRGVIGKMQNDYTTNRPYNSGVSAAGNIVNSTSQESDQYTTISTVNANHNDKLPGRYQQVYYTKEKAGNETTKEDSVALQSSATVNTYEYSGRQFKTPAQLKEIPTDSTNKYLDMPSTLKPEPCQTPSQVITSTEPYTSALKQEASVDYKPLTAQFNKVNALDLSMDETKNIDTNEKSHHRRKKGEGRSRSSKRSSSSRSLTVIQNPDTVADFLKSFEKKRRRKHVSR